VTGTETVAAIMTPAPRTIDRNHDLGAADRLVAGSLSRHLPVMDVERGALVGLVTESDVVRHAHTV
jgi:CBS domain-containing protein